MEEVRRDPMDNRTGVGGGGVNPNYAHKTSAVLTSSVAPTRADLVSGYNSLISVVNNNPIDYREHGLNELPD